MDYFLFFVLGFFMKTASSQFPDHVDLQKVGQIKYHDETYNILKPTVHKVTDHFEDFMLRRDTGKEERVFIDDDGFRHHWQGFGLTKDLRKSVKKLRSQGNRNHNNNDQELLNKDKKFIEDAYFYRRQKPAATTKKPAASTTKAGATTKKPAPATTKAGATTKKPAPATTKAGATTKKPAASTTKAGATTKKPTAATTKAVATTKKPAPATTKAPTGRSRTAAKTYFFCPFFGVIAMRGFVD